jgi:S1-C subfamily serine protease
MVGKTRNLGRRQPGRKAALALGIAAGSFCLGVFLGRWHPWAGGGVSLGQAGASVFPLRTEVEFDTGEEEPQRAVVEGTGTVLFQRFVLTVAHAVTLDRLEVTLRTPRGEVTLPVEGEPLSVKTWLVAGEQRVPLVPLALDDKADLALFLLPRRADFPGFPYAIGDSEALEIGDSIAVLGSDRVAGVLVRKGTVAALRGSAPVERLSSSHRTFLISLALTEGESGAPIVVRREGAYSLVGLAQGTYIGPRQLAWAIRIGPALEALARRGGSAEIRKFVRLCRRSRIAGGPAVPLHGPTLAAGAPPTTGKNR